MSASDEADAPPLRLNGYITRPQLWALDEACRPLRETFPDYGPYLVGSVIERPTFRDIDVRLILSDEQYDRLSDDEWSLLGFVTSRHLAAVTGLPIDFQFQRQTEASAAYGDKTRTPLGLRSGWFWHGDQRPAAPTKTSGITPGGNPVCEECGLWYGPGLPHKCVTPRIPADTERRVRAAGTSGGGEG